MKSKRAIQVLTVCFSVVLLGAYVVYAHRQAQPPAPSAPAPTTSLFPEGGSVEPEGEEHAVSASTIDGPIFRSSSLPSTPQETGVASSDSSSSSSPNSIGLETVNFRVDGSSVTTHVQQEKAPAFAPSSKGIILPVFSKPSQQTSETVSANPIQVNGQILKTGTFRNSGPPKLIGVVPPPVESAALPPSGPLQTISPVTTTTVTVPRETIIFSTKSAPVFVAPREAPAPPPAAPVAGSPTAPVSPTAPTTGTPTAKAPAAVPPPQRPLPLASAAPAPKVEAAPTQQLQRQPEQATQSITPKPRMLAPGSKSMDLRLFNPQTTAPTASPTQFPIPSTPAKPMP
jgi:hypothetical protein